jgi:hypothetical protein
VDEGAVVLLRRSKTDQAGGGYYKGIPTATTPRPAPNPLEAFSEVRSARSRPEATLVRQRQPRSAPCPP